MSEAGAQGLIVCAALAERSEALDAALAAQTRVPERTAYEPGGLGAAISAAHKTGAAWVWVLDGTAAPQPGALRALAEALTRLDGLPQPVLLTGVVRTRDGLLDSSRNLWYRRNQIDTAMAATGRRLLPVRAAVGPVLVSRRAVEAEPWPPGVAASTAALLEWTARILRDGTGYLVPDSESVALTEVRDPVGDPRTATRLLFGGAFAGLDRARLAFELAERAGTRLRKPAIAAPTARR